MWVLSAQAFHNFREYLGIDELHWPRARNCYCQGRYGDSTSSVLRDCCSVNAILWECANCARVLPDLQSWHWKRRRNAWSLCSACNLLIKNSAACGGSARGGEQQPDTERERASSSIISRSRRCWEGARHRATAPSFPRLKCEIKSGAVFLAVQLHFETARLIHPQSRAGCDRQERARLASCANEPLIETWLTLSSMMTSLIGGVTQQQGKCVERHLPQ